MRAFGFCCLDKREVMVKRNPLNGLWLFLIFACSWNFLILKIWWPGFWHFDAFVYLDGFVLWRLEIKNLSYESALYASLLKLSLLIWDGFQPILILQIVFAAVVTTYFLSLRNRYDELKGPILFLSSLGLFLPNSSWMLINVERDILFVWSLVFILVLLARLAFDNSKDWPSKGVFFVLGLSAAAATSLKQEGIIVVPVVTIQLILIGCPWRRIPIFLGSATFFSILFLVFFPLAMNAGMSSESNTTVQRQSNLFLGRSFKDSVDTLNRARSDGMVAAPNYEKIVAMSSRFSVLADMYQLKTPDSQNEVRRILEGYIDSINKNHAMFYVFRSMALGEITLLFLLLFSGFFFRTAAVGLLPLSHYLLVFLFQPVPKGRYFYFTFLSFFFLLPLILCEIRWLVRLKLGAPSSVPGRFGSLSLNNRLLIPTVGLSFVVLILIVGTSISTRSLIENTSASSLDRFKLVRLREANPMVALNLKYKSGEEFSASFLEAYQRIEDFCKRKGLKIMGPMVGRDMEWFEEDYAAGPNEKMIRLAYPVNRALANRDGEFYPWEFPIGGFVVGEYVGPYSPHPGMESFFIEAYGFIGNHLKIAKGNPYEFYLVTPKESDSPNEFKTVLYIPIE